MYSIELTTSAQKDILRLPENIKIRCEVVIDGLAKNPRPMGSKKLKGIDNIWRI